MTKNQGKLLLRLYLAEKEGRTLGNTNTRTAQDLIRRGLVHRSGRQLILDSKAYDWVRVTHFGEELIEKYRDQTKPEWVSYWVTKLNLDEDAWQTLTLGNDYARMVLGVEQQWQCAAYEKLRGRRKSRCFYHTNLVLDHCHQSGFVRGLLCRRCNTIEPHSTEWRQNNQDYLEHKIGQRRWLYLHPWSHRPVVNIHSYQELP